MYLCTLNQQLNYPARLQLHSVPSATSAHYFEYKISEEDTRPASSVDKDGEYAIASSGNNGDMLMEKQKPKSGVFLSVDLVTQLLQVELH